MIITTVPEVRTVPRALALRHPRTTPDLRRAPDRHAAGRRPSVVLRLAGLLLSAGLAACGGGSGGSPDSGAAPGSSSAADATPVAAATATDGAVSAADAALLATINAARAAGRTCGTTAMPPAGPLRFVAAVASAAAVQSAWVRATGVLSHTGEGGTSVAQRLTATGYAWSAVGENLAMGFGSIEAAVAGWFDSPGHCANLMNDAFIDLGIDHRAASDGRPSVSAMVLARPR